MVVLNVCNINNKIKTYNNNTTSILSLTQKNPQTELPKPHKPPNIKVIKLSINILFNFKNNERLYKK